MDGTQQHEMRLDMTYPSGAEEWYCPTCGRRLVLTVPAGSEALAMERGDKYTLVWGSSIGTVSTTKTVLEFGDNNAVHYGGQVVEALIADESEPAQETSSIEMSAWAVWLEDIDFGDE